MLSQIHQIKELHKSFNSQIVIKNLLVRSLELLASISLDSRSGSEANSREIKRVVSSGEPKG